MSYCIYQSCVFLRNKCSTDSFPLKTLISMKKIALIILLLLTGMLGAQAQSRTNDIPIRKLPAEVKEVLIQYIEILRESSSLDECADNFIKVAGGSLVEEDGNRLRRSIKPYSLKKDFNNVKFYASPIQITRVNARPTQGTGYGESALSGMVYKIWIAKKAGGAGMPAPISIILPENHPSIHSPKVIGIGSL